MLEVIDTNRKSSLDNVKGAKVTLRTTSTSAIRIAIQAKPLYA